MFRWLGRMITGYAPAIIIVILLISMGFALVIPKIEFKTNLNRFLPDNDLVRANERVNEQFGDDSVVHFIYIEEENTDHDVLTPDALREQYDIYQRISDVANVENVISIISILDEVSSLVDPENKTDFDDLSDDEIELGKKLFFQLLNDPTLLNLLNISISISNTELQNLLTDLQQLLDIFFSKDFNYYSSEPKAKSTLMIILINGSIEDSTLKSMSDDFRETITSDDYTQITLSHTGEYLISSDLDKASSESFSLLGIIIIVLITIILLLSFRRFSYVLLPLLTLCLAIVWTFGTMILLGIEFTVITVAIIPLMLGLGVDYSISSPLSPSP